MSLTNYIKPGQALTAAAVAQDFTDLAGVTNNIKRVQIVDRTIDHPALKGTWKSAQLLSSGAAVYTTASANPLLSGAFTVYDGEPVLVTVSGQAVFTASPGIMAMAIYVDAVRQYTLFWKGGGGAGGYSRVAFNLPLMIEGVALGTRTIALHWEPAPVGPASANWTVNNVLIEVLAVNR